MSSGLKWATMVAVAAVAGCGSSHSGGGGKHKPAAIAPVTLRVATDDEPGKPAADEILAFKRRAAALSHGAITIKPAWHAAGDVSDWDQANAQLVEQGKVAMGMIPARAWDREGVTSLRALSAPFLVDSDALFDRVVAEPVAGHMLAGLDQAGVVGLALVPEGLRHPFGFNHPLGGPADYNGKLVRAPTSATTTDIFKTLGARTTDDEPDPTKQVGAESAYPIAPPGTAAGNVTLYAKANALVINKQAFDRLDPGQQSVLRQAAIQTRDWAVNANPSDAAAAQAYCKQGNAVTTVPAADVSAMEKATAPVYAQLERDPQTKQAIADIRAIKQGVGAPEATTCGGGKPKAVEHVKTAIDGRYTFRMTDRMLRHAGVTDPGEIAENHGTFRYRLTDGNYCWKQKAPNPLNNPSECSTYSVAGQHLVFGYPDGTSETYGFKQLAGGDLKLTPEKFDPSARAAVTAFTTPIWRRVH